MERRDEADERLDARDEDERADGDDERRECDDGAGELLREWWSASASTSVSAAATFFSERFRLDGAASEVAARATEVGVRTSYLCPFSTT